LNSLNLVGTTCLKSESKEKVSDFAIRTRDLLRRAISTCMSNIQTRMQITFWGDRGIVVPVKRKGSQKLFSSRYTARNIIHCTLLPQPLGLRGLNPISRRNISSKSLSDINTFKNVLNDIRKKKGEMTSGVDKETLDGMSTKRLEKLQSDILN
jgi:hypothetical protein